MRASCSGGHVRTRGAPTPSTTTTLDAIMAAFARFMMQANVGWGRGRDSLAGEAEVLSIEIEVEVACNARWR